MEQGLAAGLSGSLRRRRAAGEGRPGGVRQRQRRPSRRLLQRVTATMKRAWEKRVDNCVHVCLFGVCVCVCGCVVGMFVALNNWEVVSTLKDFLCRIDIVRYLGFCFIDSDAI